LSANRIGPSWIEKSFIAPPLRRLRFERLEHKAGLQNIERLNLEFWNEPAAT
jgi:hypothetical protein